MPRTARSGGVSGMLHRTTVRRVDLIEGTVDSLARNRSGTGVVGLTKVTRIAESKKEEVRIKKFGETKK
jgi:hypothetical protein